MTTAWAHLPNARHIDAVLKHTQESAARSAARSAAQDAAWRAAWDAARSAAWGAARDDAWCAAWDAAWGAARSAAWCAARGAAWDAARDAARSAARDAAWDAARSAVIALVAFDGCGHLMSVPIEAVAVAAKLGIPAAVLLYPIRLAMETYEPSPPTQTTPAGSSPHC